MHNEFTTQHTGFDNCHFKFNSQNYPSNVRESILNDHIPVFRVIV